MRPIITFGAGNAVRSGIGFGAGVFSVKSLQVHLAAGVAPHESTKEDKVAGYDAIFHDTTFDDSDFVVPGEGPRPHPYLGRTSGIFLGPDGPHEKNHNPQCTRDHSGLTKCSEIAGVNLNPHEQDHAKKHVYLRSINTMAFPNFTFALRVINELQNEGINRRTLGRLLRSLEEHPVAKINACHKSLWFCGRCFCLKPTIRVFDSFGRVDVVFLSSVIDAAVRR